ncbi:hypothetical protein PITCH_A510007 [uncultured Desulfobacterium sp.]|uniref:Chromosomal replication initiator DnaA C-terminal domain-containing protein n=1 Tax=uncultured Desulfobacterium sp. TaxID=201089 RepID=A0A445N0Z0_9BACT|nr:hypothetical protein PITCH_A510007 [uncultured Desulfobacterium sp.]
MVLKAGIFFLTIRVVIIFYETFRIEKADIYSGSRERPESDARSLYCYWAVRELGYSMRELAKKLGMTAPGVGYAVARGKTISKLTHFHFKISVT